MVRAVIRVAEMAEGGHAGGIGGAGWGWGWWKGELAASAGREQAHSSGWESSRQQTCFESVVHVF